MISCTLRRKRQRVEKLDASAFFLGEFLKGEKDIVMQDNGYIAILETEEEFHQGRDVRLVDKTFQRFFQERSSRK